MKKVGVLLIVFFFFAFSGLAQDRQPDDMRLSAWEQFRTGKGTEWNIRWSEQTGLPRTVVGGRTGSYQGTPEEAARAFLTDNHELFAVPGNSEQLRHYTTREHRGIYHVTFDQYHRGVRVKGGEIRVHLCENGYVDMVNGMFYPDIDVPVTPSLTTQEAFRIAADRLDMSPEREREEEAGLIIYPVDEDYRLAWMVLVYSEFPLKDQKFIIDAFNGEVLLHLNRLTGISGSSAAGKRSTETNITGTSTTGTSTNGSDVTGTSSTASGVTDTSVTATGVTGTGRVYPSNPVHSSVAARPLPRLYGDGTLIGTYVSVFSNGFPDAYSTYNNFTFSTSTSHFDEVNVYYHIDRFRDEFINELGNPGFTWVRVVVNWSEDPGNARFSRRNYRLYFGNGSGTAFNSFARDDMVIYHEYVHRVVIALNSRMYSSADERGAINEGVADYFAGAYTGRSLSGDYAFARVPDRQRDMAAPGIKSYAQYLYQKHERDPRGELKPHDGGEFFSAILWDLRNHPDTDAHYVDRLVYKAILRVSGFADFLEFRDAMTAADRKGYKERIIEAFARRGVTDPDAPFTVTITGTSDDRPGAFVTYTAEPLGGIYPYEFFWEYRYFCVTGRDCGPDEGSWLHAGDGNSVGFTYSPDISRRDVRVKVIDAEEQVAYSSEHRLSPVQEHPLTFALHGPYPNPFNRSTILRWTLSEPSDVVLQVYDMKGRRVSVLADGRHEAGEYVTRFDGTGMASGVYIARLRARLEGGEIRETTTGMMLLK